MAEISGFKISFLTILSTSSITVMITSGYNPWSKTKAKESQQSHRSYRNHPTQNTAFQKA